LITDRSQLKATAQSGKECRRQPYPLGLPAIAKGRPLAARVTPVHVRARHIESNGRQMQQGVVKFFREDKGYGFIERDQGGDLFVHISVVDGNVDTLVRGQRVAFEEGANRRTGKLEAKNVTVIEASVERVRRYG
jgi:cold shock protein